MSSNSRIPRDSVSFSDNKFKLDYLDKMKKQKSEEETNKNTYETEEEKIIRLKEEELAIREEEFSVKEQELLKSQNLLQNELKEFALEKEKVNEEFERIKSENKREARRNYYNIREFMWEQAISMAEEILNQQISSNSLSVKNVFEGMIRKIPVAFHELEITVHPDTYESFKNEQTKESWILNNVKWKYDYSLKIGEFVVEEESEYYDYRFASIFEEIRKNLKEKNEHFRKEKENDIT